MWFRKYPTLFIYLLNFSVLVTYLSFRVSCQDVLGCGGFVKSEIPIDFSRVEIKLYTKQGSMKYQTDCAPNNGYYLIPVYDKGDYILQVQPPEGWLFEPTSVALHIDGTSDLCSQSKDINFYFKGFSIYGQVVSRGSSDGPPGVEVGLSVASDPKKTIQKTVTQAAGRFQFSQVMPGDYHISVSHPTLLFERKSVKSQVAKDNGNLSEKLIVSGYEVMGRVLGDDGEAVRGVKFILFGKDDPTLEPRHCERGLPPGYDSKSAAIKSSLSPLCHVASSEDGRFRFPLLVPGHYVVVPFYKNQNMKFDVVPSKLDIVIQHEPQVLEQEFKVEGFSVNGRVVMSPGGEGLPGASVFLNGKKLAETGEKGVFHLENMRAGSYDIQIKADKIQFSATVVKINPNTPDLPEIVASAFEVCGKLEGDELARTTPSQITFKRITPKADDLLRTQSTVEGHFCLWLTAGSYEARAENIKDSRIVFKPNVLMFVVKDAPVSSIVFHQFKAKIEGHVHCLEKCDQSVQVVLKPSEQSMGTGEQRTASILGGKFAFMDILPGKYEISVSNDAWCWHEKTLVLTVVDEDVKDVKFNHSGFLLTTISTHSTELHYRTEDLKSIEGTSKGSDKNDTTTEKLARSGKLNLVKGTNKLCLEFPGIYFLNPVGCHIFASEQYVFDTSSPTVLNIEATRHLLSGVIITDVVVTDMRVSIRAVDDQNGQAQINNNGEEAILGPLTAKRSLKDKEGYEYLFTYWAAPYKTIELQPRSDELLFYPNTKKITIQDDCMQYAVEFIGKKGLFLDGRIDPPLAGVKVTITALNGSMKPILLDTPPNGRFRVGPLHGDTKYDIQAEKQGYVLSRGKELGHFTAYKLAEIGVSVIDDQDEQRPLPGVILSLSGGTDYRRNSLTQEDGKMLFSGLGPGQYFLRAMMKEFQFDPPSHMVEVNEGGVVNVVLRGKRIAFSCYGTVTTLTGEPENGVVVEAVGRGPCSDLQEEVTTEGDGNFRLRGLKPNCDFEVRLRQTPDVNRHIERSTPKLHVVRLANEDIGGIVFVAFRPLRTMDISGNVITSNEYLSSLKVRLISENGTDQTASLGPSSFFQFLSLPMDDRQFTLSLESSLSHTSYDYSIPAEFTFKANDSYRHFTFVFQPKPTASEHELTQGSYLALPMALLIFIIVTNHARVLPLAQKVLEIALAFANPAAARARDDASAGNGSSSVSQGAVGYEPLVKKKVKPKKIQ